MNAKIFLTLTLSTTLIFPLFSQDSSDSEKKKFKTRIENIVKEVFKQVEEELGADIYDEDDSTKNITDHSYEFKQNKKAKYSPYAYLIGKKIPRNNSAVLFPENFEENFLFRYNRVEGLFLGLQSPHKYFWDEDRKVTLFGSIGYGFGVHRWEFDLGISHQLNINSKLVEVGIEGHNSVNSTDHWLVGSLENSISAMFFKFDYKDYFLRKGFSSWVSLNQKSDIADLQAKVSYVNDAFSPLEKNVNWSLFRSKKEFRVNPEISSGNVKGVSFTLSVHKLDNMEKNSSGWSVSLNTEFAGKLFKGDYYFNRYLIDIRRYQQISSYDNVNIRFRFATSEGQLPLQYLYKIGGISTLPAYSYKEYVGNRLLLTNLEYIVNGSVISEATIFPFSIVSKFNLILFYDVGYINQVSDNELFSKGFNSLKLSSLISDWGIGVGTRDGKFRLTLSWKTDRKAPANFFVRINRPF